MGDWRTTYTPTSGMGSFLKRNAADDTVAGLSPRGQGVMGAFASGLGGMGEQMQQRPQFAAPRMDEMPPVMPQQKPQGAFAQGQPRQMAGNGFLEFLRSRRQGQ